MLDGSEISKVRAEMEQEAAILQLLKNGFRSAASHEIITHALENLGLQHERLEELVGEEHAASFLVEAIGKDYMPETLEVEVIGSLDEMDKLLREHGGSLEIGEKVIAHFPPGTVRDTTVIRGYQSIVFQDLCPILLKVTEEGKYVLQLDWDEYLLSPIST